MTSGDSIPYPLGCLSRTRWVRLVEQQPKPEEGAFNYLRHQVWQTCGLVCVDNSINEFGMGYWSVISRHGGGWDTSSSERGKSILLPPPPPCHLHRRRLLKTQPERRITRERQTDRPTDRQRRIHSSQIILLRCGIRLAGQGPHSPSPSYPTPLLLQLLPLLNIQLNILKESNHFFFF